MKKLLTIFAFVLCFVAANATHLTNGSMYYEYMGTETNGDYRYKITLVLVRDCISSTVQFDDMVRLGKDVEKDVLARGVRLHLEDRLIVNGNKTVILD